MLGDSTCVVDHHDIRESDQVVESYYVVQRRRGVSTHVPHDDGLW